MNLKRLCIALSLPVVLLSFGCGGQKTDPIPDSAEALNSDKTSPPAKTEASDATGATQSSFERDRAREKLLSTILVEMFEKQHLQRKPLDDDLSKAAHARYLKQLDPAKSFLLQSHVDTLQKHALKVDDDLKSGNFTLAIEGTELYKSRVEVIQKVVDTHLAKPFDLTSKETLETDADKRSWAKTEDELRERWRKVLKLQALERIARQEEQAKAREELKASGELKPDELPKDDIPKTLAGREAKAREQMAKDYSGRFARIAQQEHIDAIDQFLNAIAHVYDPHSAYLPPARKENFDIQMSGSLEGIGAVLSVHEHHVKVVRIVPGSASWRQGELEAGDTVLMVAQNIGDPVDVVDMPLNEVVRMIRGKKGTTVKLTVKKGDGRLKTIPIVRDVVNIEAAYAKGAILNHPKSGEKVGYIDLPSFYGNTSTVPGKADRSSSADVRRLLVQYAKKGINAVILDLRGNGGGYLSDARRMGGLFIDEGPIVQTRAANGYKRTLEDDDPSVVFKGRVVVMVDSFSASASEIVAGALQDYGRAVVVGTDYTHGKGTVQMIVNLDRFIESPKDRKFMPLGVLKLTEQQFFRVSGASTQNRGVVPDIILPNPAGFIESGERYLDFAIPWSSVSQVKHKPWKAAWDKSALKSRSEGRLANNAAFTQVKDRVAMLKTRREQTEISLNYTNWSEERERDNAKLKSLTPDLEKEPKRFDAVEYDYTGQAAAPKRPTPGGDTRKLGDDPVERWIENLARDIWIEESLLILKDMRG